MLLPRSPAPLLGRAAATPVPHVLLKVVQDGVPAGSYRPNPLRQALPQRGLHAGRQHARCRQGPGQAWKAGARQAGLAAGQRVQTTALRHQKEAHSAGRRAILPNTQTASLLLALEHGTSPLTPRRDATRAPQGDHLAPRHWAGLQEEPRLLDLLSAGLRQQAERAQRGPWSPASPRGAVAWAVLGCHGAADKRAELGQCSGHR